MLERLQVRDVALIESLDLDLGPGLNLITGETGSGKSILLDALGFVLGGRATSDLIRAQAEQASVSAVFAPPAAWLKRWRPWFEDKGLPFDEQAVLLKRELNRAGRGRAWINGEPCNVGVLAELGSGLVDFHGQHQNQALLRPGEHLEYLDRFGALDAERLALSAAYDGVLARRQALEGPAGTPQERQRALELLGFQLAELAELAPQAGELAGLRARVELQATAGRRGEMVARAAGLLGEDEASAVATASLALGELRRLAGLDPGKQALVEQLERGLVELKDVASALADEAQAQELDPRELERLQARLHAWESASRKLRCPDDELPQAWERLKAEQAALLAALEDEGALKAALESAKRAYSEAAQHLSSAREKSAARMVKAMTRELQELIHPKALFTVRLARRFDEDGPYQIEGRSCKGDRSGVDDVEFLIAPNPGEAPKPLARIASGGELSRVTLALKTVFSRQEGAPCLVFDEIDSGISGRVAALVGSRILGLAGRHQVLCITHLPQIACLPAKHVRVWKEVAKGQTTTRAQALDRGGREAELAALIGGEAPGDSALAHARELLGQAQASGA
jgi:DNA repair protein RecN (Recombination protein N)